EDLLTRPNRIDVGGIEEIDPQIEGFLDDRPAVFLVQHPFVNPAFRVPEPHATEADSRHVHSGVSELRVVYGIFLLSTIYTENRTENGVPSGSTENRAAIYFHAYGCPAGAW